MPTTFADLIALAPWREAVTYRDTWPHEYVLSHTDDQQALLATICARLLDGEGVSCRFFHMENIYLFFGDYKYWLMTDYHDVDPHYDEDDYVINRARPSRTLPPLRHYARGRPGDGPNRNLDS